MAQEINHTEHDAVEPSVDNHMTATTLSKEATIEPPNGGPVASSRTSASPKRTKEKSPTKFGKANPLRDILLLLAFLGGLMLLTSENAEKKTEEDHEDDQQPTFASIETKIKDLARKTSSVTLRNCHCSLFLHTGSIPNTGFGYFAGRNYTIGEIVLEDYRTIPVPVSVLESGGDYLHATPSALVLKHHPILYNIEGVLHYKNENDAASKLQLRATKAITEGDELFVEYDPKFHNNPMLFNHIPTESHYSRVNEIVTDALRSVPDQAHRSGRVTCRMAPVMRFVTRVVARYDPMVATLLPESYKRAKYYRTLHPSVAALRNSSLLQLRYKGVCMDDIMAPLNSDDDNADDHAAASAHHHHNIAAVAQRKFSRGTVVSTVPLYVMKTATTASSLPPSQTCGLEQDCPSGRQQSNCFVHENMTFVSFCPLGPAIDPPLVDEGNDTTEGRNVPLPNVEYRWSQHPGVTEHFEMRDAFKYSTSIMGWDVVALRDIDIGEKLKVQGMPPDVPDHVRALYGDES